MRGTLTIYDIPFTRRASELRAARQVVRSEASGHGTSNGATGRALPIELTLIYLDSLGFTWIHLDSLG